MPKSLGALPKIPLTPTKKLAGKNPNFKTPDEQRLQDVAGAGSSTGSTVGIMLKKEAIAWRRVCDTVRKYHNDDPETFVGHSEWLAVGVLRTDGALKVFIPKPQGKPKELTYYFLSGDKRIATTRGNVDLYPRYITEGVDLVNKPDKQSKEINYLIWKDLCHMWPDDLEAKEHERFLEASLRNRQTHSRAASTPPATIKLSNTPPKRTSQEEPNHQDKHFFVNNNATLGNSKDVTNGLLRRPCRQEPIDLYSSPNNLQNNKVLDTSCVGQGTMPEFLEDLLLVIGLESKLKGISRTETTRWKALESLLSQPPDVDVEIVPVTLRTAQDLSKEEMKPCDVSISKTDRDIIDEYLDEGFPSRKLMMELTYAKRPASGDQSTYGSFCGQLTKDIPKIIHDVLEWKAFYFVSAAVSKEIKYEVDVLWLVCVFHETRNMSRQDFLSVAKKYHERAPLLGAANPLVLEGLALAYYQITGFFLDAANDAQRVCEVFEPGEETDLILKIASTKTETDLCNLLRQLKEVTVAQFSSLLLSARARAEQTDQLVIRTWKTADPDLKLLLNALEKHHIKPFGEVAASIQRKTASEAI